MAVVVSVVLFEFVNFVFDVLSFAGPLLIFLLLGLVIDIAVELLDSVADLGIEDEPLFSFHTFSLHRVACSQQVFFCRIQQFLLLPY